MKLWYSAAELAALALPGLPERAESLARLAERKGWNASRFARLRRGRGGGMEYRIELLPIDARMALLGTSIEPEAGAMAASAAPDAASGTTEAARGGRDARLHLLGMFRAWREATGLPTCTATANFADLYNAGRIEAPDWVRAAVKSLSRSTLFRWLSTAREGDVDRLAVDRGAARRGKGVLDEAEGGAIKAKILTLIAHQPHLTADHLRTICRDAFGDTITWRDRAVPMPGVRAFQLVLKRLKVSHRVELLALHNPDAFKSRMRISGSRAHLVTALNGLWEIDASPADALCRDGRHSIYVCVDVFSRRLITFVSRTARAEAVGMLLKKALIAWGVPDRIKTDNGSDFTARATRRLLAQLRIETETSAPFSPEEKGVIERAIGTVQRDVMPLLPGFVGHSVADRKAIENRKAFSKRLGQDDARAFEVDLTASELASYLDRLIEDRYAHRPHGGIGKATPFQMHASWSGPIRRIEDESALAILLAPVAGKDGLRQVGKQGIRIDGSHYLAANLMPGDTVFCRMDPLDLGRLFVFAEDGETFRAIAICPELAGTDPAAAVAAAQAAQKAFIAERVAPIRKEAAKIKPRDMVDAVARQAAKDAGKLAEFPKKAIRHSTPALDGAAETGRALDIATGRRAPKPNAPSAAETAMLARIEAEIGAASAPEAPAKIQPLRPQETDHQRFRRALALEERVGLGEAIDTDAAIWLGGYQQTAEYRAHKRLHQQFGDAALR
jgi:transposase InsO family protein